MESVLIKVVQFLPKRKNKKNIKQTSTMEFLGTYIYNYRKRRKLGFLLYGIIIGLTAGIIICKINIL